MTTILVAALTYPGQHIAHRMPAARGSTFPLAVSQEAANRTSPPSSEDLAQEWREWRQKAWAQVNREDPLGFPCVDPAVLETAGDAATVAKLCVRLLEDCADKAIASGDDEGFFVGVRPWCEAKLLSSAPIRAAGRAELDAAARPIAGELDALRREASIHALSSRGPEILSKAAALAFEEGEYEEALVFARRSSDLYPETRTSLYPLVVLCLARISDRAGILQIAGEVKASSLGGVPVQAGRKSLRLEEFISSRGRMPPSWEYRRPGDYYVARPGAPAGSAFRWRYTLAEGETSEAPLLLPAVSPRRAVVSSPRKLVSLELATGKVTFSRRLEAPEPSPFDAPFVGVSEKDEIAYTSSPTRDRRAKQLLAVDLQDSKPAYLVPDPASGSVAEAVGGSLYGALADVDRGLSGTFVVRVDRVTGKIIWSTRILLAREQSGRGPREPAAPPIAAFWDGAVFVDGGSCVAALDASSGHILWLRSAPAHIPYLPIASGAASIFRTKDGLDAFDRTSGRLLWKSACSELWRLEGTSAGKVVLSRKGAMCLSAASGKLLWKTPHPSAARGKGAITEDALYLPTAEGIEKFSLADGKRTSVFSWPDPGRDPGSLALLAGGGFLTSSPAGVSCFLPPSSRTPSGEGSKPADRKVSVPGDKPPADRKSSAPGDKPLRTPSGEGEKK